MTTLKVGDFVKSTNNGYEGQVKTIAHMVDSEDWLDAQKIKPTKAQRKGLYVSILLDGWGAVSVPINTCTKIDPIVGFARKPGY